MFKFLMNISAYKNSYTCHDCYGGIICRTGSLELLSYHRSLKFKLMGSGPNYICEVNTIVMTLSHTCRYISNDRNESTPLEQ